MPEVLSPGGLEDYFTELAPVLRDKAPPAEYDALAHRYGLTIQTTGSRSWSGPTGSSSDG